MSSDMAQMRETALRLALEHPGPGSVMTGRLASSVEDRAECFRRYLAGIWRPQSDFEATIVEMVDIARPGLPSDELRALAADLAADGETRRRVQAVVTGRLLEKAA